MLINTISVLLKYRIWESTAHGFKILTVYLLFIVNSDDSTRMLALFFKEESNPMRSLMLVFGYMYCQQFSEQICNKYKLINNLLTYFLKIVQQLHNY